MIRVTGYLQITEIIIFLFAVLLHVLNQISYYYLFHIIFRIMSYLETIYLILLICSVIINQRLINQKNDVNQCGLSYRQVMKVVTESIQVGNQTIQTVQLVQPIQQDQIQPVQLPQFGLFEKNRNYIDMILMNRI